MEQNITPPPTKSKFSMRAAAAFVADFLRRSGFWKSIIGSGGSQLRRLVGSAGRAQGNLTRRAAAIYVLVRSILVLTLIALVVIIAVGITALVKLLITP